MMLGLTPHGMDLGFFWALAFLGLGFGFGSHLHFMSSFNFEKTRRKNFKCEGECPKSIMLYRKSESCHKSRIFGREHEKLVRVVPVEQDALMSPNPRGKLEDLAVGAMKNAVCNLFIL